MEHYREARLWNDVFNFAQTYIGMPLGTIRATVLIETLPAAFQMEEILFELRHHSSGLNCGRWDYIFSFIKKRRMDKSAVFPDRKDVTMEVGFMDAYVRLLIQTCHKYVDAPLLKIVCLLSFKDVVFLLWVECPPRFPSRGMKRLTRLQWPKFAQTSCVK